MLRIVADHCSCVKRQSIASLHFRKFLHCFQ